MAVANTGAPRQVCKLFSGRYHGAGASRGRAPRWGPQPVVLENGSVGYLICVTSEACLRLTHQGKQNLQRENRCVPLSAVYAVTWGW